MTAVAGRDLTVHGSNFVSEHATTLVAGHNLAITADTNTSVDSHFKQKKTSGLFSGGGIGVTVGSQQLSVDQRGTSTTAAASTAGSTQGSVTLHAGQAYTQRGSDVLAPGGDIAIDAARVDIVEARESETLQTQTRFRQGGLTLALSSPVISALQTAQQMGQAASRTGDARMQALAAANVALAAGDAARAIQAGQGTTIAGKDHQIPTGKTNPDGTPQTRDATAADKAVGSYANAQYERLKDSDPQEAAKRAEGGAYRVAAHAVVGGLTGDVGGTLRAAGIPVLRNGVPLEGRWVATLADGPTINVRSVSSSAVGRWTIDVKNATTIEAAAHKNSGTNSR